MTDPRITDNDAGEIAATVNGQEIRGWSYKDDAERRLKMRMAHEFAEGWFQATERAAKIVDDYDDKENTMHGYRDQIIAAAIRGVA